MWFSLFLSILFPFPSIVNRKLQANEDYAQYIYPIKCACFLKLMKNLECIYSEYHLSEYNEILNTLNLNLWDVFDIGFWSYKIGWRDDCHLF